MSYNGYIRLIPGKRTERLDEDAGEDKGNAALAVKRKGNKGECPRG